MPEDVFRFWSLVAGTVVFAGIIFGIMQRKKQSLHVKIMLTCFVADLAVVLAIELARGAVEQAIELNGGVLAFHVPVSVAAVLLWFVAVFTGFRRRKGELVTFHKVNALLFLACRSANWVSAFFL